MQDEILRAVTAKTLQIEKANITERKLEELVIFSARSNGTISLEGLQHAVNLRYLDLCGSTIGNSTSIRDLREVEVLNLSRNMLRDIQALRGFRQLLWPGISRNSLYTMDISAPAGMINLEELNLEYSKVNNLVHLGNIKRLKRLYVGIENGPFPLGILDMLEELKELHMNKMWLYDIANLTCLKHIEVLDISTNLFYDLSLLQRMKDSLRNLNISSCKYLRDLSISEESPNLEVLDISLDRIKGFSFLKKLENLKDPRATQSGLCDSRNLKGLTRVERLDISENRVEHTEILKEMKLLRYFKASYCSLKDTDFLKNAKDLIEPNVLNNHIKYIGVLKGCEHITTLGVENSDICSTDPPEDAISSERLGLSHSNISDLASLKDLTNLSMTDLYNSVIIDSSPLKELINSSSLQLDHNGVMDLSPLEECMHLSPLILRVNYVTDVTPLTKLKNLYEFRLDENPTEDITVLEDTEYYKKFSYWDSLKKCKSFCFRL